MKLFEYFWGEERSRREGVRISCTRFLPRGVKKEDYSRLDYFDVWVPALAPSRVLIAWAKKRDLSDKRVWAQFKKRYETEMAKSDPRQLIRLISVLAMNTPISLGCSCAGTNCHRFLLAQLVHKAAEGKF